VLKKRVQQLISQGGQTMRPGNWHFFGQRTANWGYGEVKLDQGGVSVSFKPRSGSDRITHKMEIPTVIAEALSPQLARKGKPPLSIFADNAHGRVRLDLPRSRAGISVETNKKAPGVLKVIVSRNPEKQEVDDNGRVYHLTRARPEGAAGWRPLSGQRKTPLGKFLDKGMKNQTTRDSAWRGVNGWFVKDMGEQKLSADKLWWYTP
jgi:hypothetical protein